MTARESADPSLIDLERRGYTVVRGFFSPDEVKSLVEAYEMTATERAGRVSPFGRREPAAAASSTTYYQTYPNAPIPPRLMTALRPKLESLASTVRARTSLKSDTVTYGLYFDSNHLVYGWHQDTESFFRYQNPFHGLNIWIPIRKPAREKTNLCVVPFDVLQERDPRAKALVNSGSRNFRIRNGQTWVADGFSATDDEPASMVLACDIEEIKECPYLSAGDMLVTREDIIHRTQDGDTQRLSVSFRVQPSSCTVTRKTFAATAHGHKLVNMLNDFTIYGRIMEAFRNRAEMTVGELQSYVTGETPTPPMSVTNFLAGLLSFRHQEGLLSPGGITLKDLVGTACSCAGCLPFYSALEACGLHTTSR